MFGFGVEDVWFGGLGFVGLKHKVLKGLWYLVLLKALGFFWVGANCVDFTTLLDRLLPGTRSLASLTALQTFKALENVGL